MPQVVVNSRNQVAQQLTSLVSVETLQPNMDDRRTGGLLSREYRGKVGIHRDDRSSGRPGDVNQIRIWRGGVSEGCDVLSIPAVVLKQSDEPSWEAHVEQERDHAALWSRGIYRSVIDAAAKASACAMSSGSSSG